MYISSSLYRHSNVYLRLFCGVPKMSFGLLNFFSGAHYEIIAKQFESRVCVNPRLSAVEARSARTSTVNDPTEAP